MERDRIGRRHGLEQVRQRAPFLVGVLVRTYQGVPHGPRHLGVERWVWLCEGLQAAVPVQEGKARRLCGAAEQRKREHTAQSALSPQLAAAAPPPALREAVAS